MFDLKADPLELSNLAELAEYQDLRQKFREEVARHSNSDVRYDLVIDSQRRRKLIARALMKGKVTTRDHQPQFDASTQNMRNTIDLDDLEARSRFPPLDTVPA
ncbi:hypothetical protein FZZ93_08435 [Halomonas eurihalina]|uniref:Choline sulfatase enzyme C-terminal domain-containing protein n=1 Tax=Halomonas eurihalina TaxID=42566 RepID=A0A5D9D920_HALER|nr:hypothetical protein [Halomonas eurihalina]MDR5860031.1 hypothetical protein [Halomonas eurihalina]TZG39792.1 hypothetical protein FZZ93_08435 [Halomonas eurihalina]